MVSTLVTHLFKGSETTDMWSDFGGITVWEWCIFFSSCDKSAAFFHVLHTKFSKSEKISYPPLSALTSYNLYCMWQSHRKQPSIHYLYHSCDPVTVGGWVWYLAVQEFPEPLQTPHKKNPGWTSLLSNSADHCTTVGSGFSADQYLYNRVFLHGPSLCIVM